MNREGTILESTRSEDFVTEEGQRHAVEVLKRNKIEALVVIGGNGSFKGATQLWERWHIPCVGVPATIDNDINGSDNAIGADTAINTALCNS
jgi:6-phosphofructokinase 1